jgi:hypothetical protein
MIDPKVFTEEMLELQSHFDRKLTDTSFKRYHAILTQSLTTDEFKKGVIWAYRYLKPHPSFFPSPQEMIEAAQGSIRDRAIIEWNSLEKSEIGRKALANCDSEDKSFRRKEFIENFLAFAKDASPDDLRIKVCAIAPSDSDRPRLLKPNPLTWTDEQKNWTYEQWEKYLHEQNSGNAAIYAEY